jgi:hypothetical protein
MKKPRLMLVLTFVGMIVPAPLMAQATASDVKCLLVSNAFAKAAKEAKAKQLAQTAMLFYGARVSALPTARMRETLLAQRKLITPANAGTTMTACARSMEGSLRNLQTVSGGLTSAK